MVPVHPRAGWATGPAVISLMQLCAGDRGRWGTVRDGTGRDGMGWDGMGWDGKGPDGTAQHGTVR